MNKPLLLKRAISEPAAVPGADQHEDAAPDSRERVKRRQHPDRDTDQCVFHLPAPYVEATATMPPEPPASSPHVTSNCSIPADRVSSRPRLTRSEGSGRYCSRG